MQIKVYYETKEMPIPAAMKSCLGNPLMCLTRCEYRRESMLGHMVGSLFCTAGCSYCKSHNLEQKFVYCDHPKNIKVRVS